MKKDAATQAEITKMLIAAGMDPYVAAQKDLGKYFAELDIENMKRQAPIIKLFLDNAMVRQQALNASNAQNYICLLYTSPSPRDRQKSRMPSSA